MKLLLDHHYSPAIAEQLRYRGLDVQSALERGWHAETDERLLALCAGEQRALLTNDVADFTVLARRWNVAGKQHFGLIFTADRSLPRGRDLIGTYVSELEGIMQAYPDDFALIDQIHWLR